jgi:hypothetical protein
VLSFCEKKNLQRANYAYSFAASRLEIIYSAKKTQLNDIK